MRVLRHPSPALKGQARAIDPAADASLRELVRTMAETMYEESGIGLAAPQVGVDKRVIVIDIEDKLMAVCNPTIVEYGPEKTVEEEGCLSVPGISVPVERSLRVVCSGQTIEGGSITIEAEDLLARVLQHEIDHLDGILILDRCPPELRKSMIQAYNEANRL